jgi:ABC-type nitrate/sulfonate/bicarbonate transport system substrate-binding protein
VTSLRVGVFSPSVLLRLAARTGALDRHGLLVTESPVDSSPAQFRALLAGEIDAALTSPDNVVAYRLVPENPLGATADVRIVLGVDRGLGLALYGRRGLTSAADLRGGVVGVDVRTSGFAFAAYEILGRRGLAIGRDYRVREMGSTPRRLEALLASDCDATMLNAGNDLRADDAGLPRLGRVVDVSSPYLGTVLAVAGGPTVAVRALAAALREAGAQLRAGNTTEAALREAEAIGLTPELAHRYVERLLDPDEGLVVDLPSHLAGLTPVIALRRRHSPGGLDDHDALATALAAGSGLVDVDPTEPADRAR